MAKPLHRIASGIRNLEPWPAVVTRVLDLAGDEDAVPGDIVQLLSTDVALTARVLQLCNSAVYGFQREITSLSEAVNMLGVAKLVNLVLTSSVGRYFQAGQGSRDEILWERSLCCAVAGGVLARAHGEVDPAAAYTTSLLANMGFLVMQRHLVEYEPLIERGVARGLGRLEAERRVLGLDHAQIGARLARWCELPELLVDAIANHHAPETAHIDPLLTAVTSLSEGFVDLALAAGSSEAVDREPDAFRVLRYPIRASALELTGFEVESLAELVGTLREEIARTQELFAAR